MAGMRRRMQVCLQLNGMYRRERKLARTLEIRIYYVFVLRTENQISFLYYYLLLDDFEYIYIYI